MTIFTAVIAYLPEANQSLMDETKKCIESTKQFTELGEVVAYHATEAVPPPGLCSSVHSAFAGVPIFEYRNGGLMDNWRQMLYMGFSKPEVDWVLMVCNDFFWKEGAASQLKEMLPKLSPMTYYLVKPTAIFLLNRKLYNAMSPMFMDYWPASWEDADMACQAWAVGGEVDFETMDSLGKHDSRATIRHLGGDYRSGTNNTNYGKNTALFEQRWEQTIPWPAEPSRTRINKWRLRHDSGR